MVDEVLAKAQGLKVTEGKLVRELMPDLRWNKGHAVFWLLERLRLGPDEVCSLCFGENLTGEDMVDAVRDHGVTISIVPPRHPLERAVPYATARGFAVSCAPSSRAAQKPSRLV